MASITPPGSVRRLNRPLRRRGLPIGTRIGSVFEQALGPPAPLKSRVGPRSRRLATKLKVLLHQEPLTRIPQGGSIAQLPKDNPPNHLSWLPPSGMQVGIPKQIG